MSEVKVNKITPTANCGTVTLGDSGDTFSLPAGVTLSNAGSITNSGTITNTGTISGGTITGTIDNQVNWDTTAKTAGFTAVAGNGYFVNTTSGAITVTLPATPTAGDLVGIKDYANTANTNNITVDRNGSNIQGVANNYTISTQGLSIILIYVDGTQGWVSTGAARASDISEQQLFVTATGGTITTCGDYKIHVFTGPGTFCVSCAGNPVGSTTVDYLVIAGGGAGSGNHGAGGGGGGARVATNTICSGAPSKSNPISLPVSVTSYPITVGAGGTSPPTGTAPNGSNSVFSTITSAGGGGSDFTSGLSGGSGGGAKGEPGTGVGGTGNTPPVSPPQGSNGGGSGAPAGNSAGGGGGGACAVGGTGQRQPNSSPPGPGQAGPGGIGLYVPTSWIGPSAPSYGQTGPNGRYFSGGGGGGAGSYGNRGTGGTGGGAPGWHGPGGPAPSATTNTGGGGGGGSGDAPVCGGNGGSGIVIIRYKYQ